MAFIGYPTFIAPTVVAPTVVTTVPTVGEYLPSYASDTTKVTTRTLSPFGSDTTTITTTALTPPMLTSTYMDVLQPCLPVPVPLYQAPSMIVEHVAPPMFIEPFHQQQQQPLQQQQPMMPQRNPSRFSRMLGKSSK